MLNQQNKDLCRAIISLHDTTHQTKLVIEECSELIKAICKCERDEYGVTQEHFNNFIEELADVIVMCQQMLLIFNVSMDDINRMANAKLLRTLERGNTVERH